MEKIRIIELEKRICDKLHAIEDSLNKGLIRLKKRYEKYHGFSTYEIGITISHKHDYIETATAVISIDGQGTRSLDYYAPSHVTKRMIKSKEKIVEEIMDRLRVEILNDLIELDTLNDIVNEDV